MKPQRLPGTYPLRQRIALRLLFQPYIPLTKFLQRRNTLRKSRRTLAVLVTAFVHLSKNTTGGVAEAVSGCTLRCIADLRRTKHVYQYIIFVLSSIIEYNL